MLTCASLRYVGLIVLPVWRVARTIRPHIMYLAYPLLTRLMFELQGYSRLMSASHRYRIRRRLHLSRCAHHLAMLLCCAEFEARLIRKYIYSVNSALAVPPCRTAAILSVLYWRHTHRDPFATTGVAYDYLVNQQDTYKRMHPGSQDRVSPYFYNPRLRRIT